MRRLACFTLRAALLIGALLSAPLLAANFQTGVIDDVQKKERAIVVDDSWYRLAPDIRVHGLAGNELKRNMKIVFVAQGEGTSAAVITEIWVLSDNVSPAQ